MSKEIETTSCFLVKKKSFIGSNEVYLFDPGIIKEIKK